MDFDDAKRKLETDEERLIAALDAIKKWDSEVTQTVIDSTGRMSLDPEMDYVSPKGKGKERADPKQW